MLLFHFKIRNLLASAMVKLTTLSGTIDLTSQFIFWKYQCSHGSQPFYLTSESKVDDLSHFMRLCYIIRVPQKQRRLNDESVYIIISFLLHYSGCQNRHANYKYKHNTSKLENEAMYTNYTCTTKTKTT